MVTKSKSRTVNTVLFRGLLVFKDIDFLERTSLFGKLPFLSPYSTFHKFRNLCACFDLVLVQLLVIERTKSLLE